jgi:hypothetical protein
MTAAVQIARVDLTAADPRETATLTDDADAARLMGLRAGTEGYIEPRRTLQEEPTKRLLRRKKLTGNLSVSIPH